MKGIVPPGRESRGRRLPVYRDASCSIITRSRVSDNRPGNTIECERGKRFFICSLYKVNRLYSFFVSFRGAQRREIIKLKERERFLTPFEMTVKKKVEYV
jgi:hypothetical protein